MSGSPYTPDAMQKRFAALQGQIEEIERFSPRHERDEKYPTLTKLEADDFKARIKLHEAELYDLKIEYAFLAQALGGRVMSKG